MVVAGLIVTVLAIAIPSINITDRMRLDAAAREVQQELRGARLRAVNVNRRLEVRFNCPTAGQFRVVEGGWPDAGRCDQSRYPYPAPADAAYQVPQLPRYDGPIRFVHPRVSLTGSALVLEFAPDGRTMKLEGGTPRLIASETITLTLNGNTRTVNVNALGKVQLQ
jgi:Tfp pilus assembly protein FimT